MPEGYGMLIRDWCENHSYRETCLFVERLAKKGLRIRDIYVVLETIDETCIECWDGNNDCQCWNDE